MDNKITSGCYAGRTVEEVAAEDPEYIAKCVQIALLTDGLRPLLSTLPTLSPSVPHVPTANLLAAPLTSPSHKPAQQTTTANDLSTINFSPMHPNPSLHIPNVPSQQATIHPGNEYSSYNRTH